QAAARDVSARRCAVHVRRALDALPVELARAVDNVAVVVEEQNRPEPDLYRLYESDEWMPSKITIYRRPLVADFPNPEELEDEIRKTVLHELGHYFGIDEDRLTELGYE